MKRLILVSVAALFVALVPSSGVAYAQHPHGPGGASSMHDGASGMHGSGSSDAAAGHSASSVKASTNPGGVLDHNTKLASKLESLLRLSGPNALQTLKADASTFKNFGQFVAAAHVSNNLGILFSDLQAKMTGPNAVSLGKAIQQLKPTANAKTETKKANTQVDEDIKETS